MDSAKDRILTLLKQNKRLSTSRIAGMLGIDYNYALELLEQLFSEKKLNKDVETNATYWYNEKE